MKQILISMIAALALCLSAQAQEGPAVPKLMGMPEFYDQFDATGQYIDNLIWGLRTTSESDATALAEQLTARAKWDRDRIEGMSSGKYENNSALYNKLTSELKNWVAFYVRMREVVNFFFSEDLRRDPNDGSWYLDRQIKFPVGVTMAGVQASMAGVLNDKVTSFTYYEKSNKCCFCSTSLVPIVADADQIAMAKRDQNMLANIGILFTGYPVEWCESTQRGSDQYLFSMARSKARGYANFAKIAIESNSPDVLEFQPMPKAGSMNGSWKAQALALAKANVAGVTDAVITSDDWWVEKNALGTPIRRIIRGYIIRHDSYGKTANEFSWAQDYQGGSYGKLHTWGMGKLFYVK